MNQFGLGDPSKETSLRIGDLWFTHEELLALRELAQKHLEEVDDVEIQR